MSNKQQLSAFSQPIQHDLNRVNGCLINILNCIEMNVPPSQRLEYIKEWAIDALKALPVNNNELVAPAQ
jgi:hypothetical protein